MNSAVERDGYRCVRCGTLVASPAGVTIQPYSVHHRRLGDRTDNRPSNLLTLCGSGTTGCHGWVHAHSRDARTEGWIVSRHLPRGGTTVMPVKYTQPSREGYCVLGDDFTVQPWENCIQ